MWKVAIYIGLSYLAAHFVTCMFVLTTALLGVACGVRVLAVSIGSGIVGALSVTWRIRTWEWSFGIVPLIGYVRFLGSGSETADENEGVPLTWNPESRPSEQIRRSESLPAAHPLVKLSLIIVGPLSQLLLVAILLAIPVLRHAPQLEFAPGELGQLAPSAAPGLRLSTDASTWNGQARLAIDVTREFFGRMAFFRSFEGWGGYCSWIAMSGWAGSQSFSTWLALIGLLSLLTCTMNLLPIGASCGMALVRLLVEMSFGEDVAEKWNIRLLIVTLPALFALLGRILVADYFWIRALF